MGNKKRNMSTSNDSKPDNYLVNAKICRLVEKFPCMYDRSNPHYLKKDVVDKAWIKIAKEMDDSIPSCKERWRNIRTSFARSININKVPASANRTKPYYLHEEIQFLAKHITPGIPVSRRSNASYYSFGEESEVVEVSVGEESFDGFAAMIHDEVSQGQQSSADESNGVNKFEDINMQEQIEQQQQLQLQQQQQQQQQQQANRELEAEAAPLMPMCPPKKRLRILESLTPEVERDIKPTDLTADTNFDAIFLQGLLPEMKAMDFRQKILFKRRIYEVIGEIFENDANATNLNVSNNKFTPTTTTSNAANQNACTTNVPQSTVNNGDLTILRQLNRLLQNADQNAHHVSTVPKSVASISSTVRSTTPATATVAVHRGAVTRSGSSLLRVTMVNPPGHAASTTYSNLNSTNLKQNQIVKQEPDLEE